MSMRIEIAKAIWHRRNVLKVREGYMSPTDAEMIELMSDVDACLTALMKPTEAMAIAGGVFTLGTSATTKQSVHLGHEDAAEIFTTMIRAAKEELQQ